MVAAAMLGPRLSLVARPALHTNFALLGLHEVTRREKSAAKEQQKTDEELTDTP